MTQQEADTLKLGLYILVWSDGGHSIASVGYDEVGHRWYAPTNWLKVPSTKWGMVERVILLHTQHEKTILDRIT